MLQSLDTHWREHLSSMEHLRQGIHLRGYAQKDPRQEYKRESFQLFTNMLDAIKYDVISLFSATELQAEDDLASFVTASRLISSCLVGVSFSMLGFCFSGQVDETSKFLRCWDDSTGGTTSEDDGEYSSSFGSS